MKKKYQLFVIFVWVLGFSFGQFNVQTGYDFGLLKFPKPYAPGNLSTEINREFNREIDCNTFHRFSIIGEYILKSNWVLSSNFGYDLYQTKAKSQLINVNTNNNICLIEDIKYNAHVSTVRFDLSFGYRVSLSEKSELAFKGHYGLFMVHNHRIFESEKFVRHEICSEQTVISSDLQMVDFVDMNKLFGDDGEMKIRLNQFSVSVEYRYQMQQIKLNTFLGFGPMQREFTINGSGTGADNFLFMLGLRIGYELPSSKDKNKTNEK
jgi:hypothetical protein